jgi:nucleoside-diphosphate-sugar epimerase
LLPILDGILEAAAANEAKLVVVDNVYLYGKITGPVTEALPTQPLGPIGRLRADMTEILLQAHQRGDVCVAIGRAADFYGPGVRAALANEALVRRAINGKSVGWPGRLDVPHSLMFVEDLARSLVVLGEREEALGQVWHLPHAPALTPRQFLSLLFEEAGQMVPRIRSLPSWAIRAAGLVDPTARAFAELHYLFEAPFVMDSGRYQQTFGEEATPYREGVRQTLASLGFSQEPVRVLARMDQKENQ